MVAATNSETLTKHYPVMGKHYPVMGKYYPVMTKHYPVMGKYYPENTHAVVPIVHFSWADLVRRPSHEAGQIGIEYRTGVPDW